MEIIQQEIVLIAHIAIQIIILNNVHIVVVINMVALIKMLLPHLYLMLLILLFIQIQNVKYAMEKDIMNERLLLKKMNANVVKEKQNVVKRIKIRKRRKKEKIKMMGEKKKRKKKKALHLVLVINPLF